MFSYLMPDIVAIRKVTEYDSYNSPTYTDEFVQGKIEYQFRNITNARGTEIVSSGTFRTNADITINDMIQVGGDFKQFIQVQPQTDFNGVTQYNIGWF